MGRYFFIFAVLMSVAGADAAQTVGRAADYVAPNTYNNMYPYMTNSMRTNLTSGNTTNQNTAQIDVLTRTIDVGAARRVVPRSGRTTARAAVTGNAAGAGVARAATASVASVANTSGANRRVVARAARTGTNANVARAGRTDTTRTVTLINTGSTADGNISSARCLADYAACMNGYCERENTEYNRCYCSAQLAQIDSKYQPEIDRLVKELITVQGQNNWTQAEMDEYWMDVVGKYSGQNTWANIDDALNIDWASTESRVRGQSAFVTGHEYCVQHLQGCFYMATNLRDAYRSEIARDCNAYETSLQKLKNAAESLVESYK